MTTDSLSARAELIGRQRQYFDRVLGARPVPSDIRLRPTDLGGVPALEITSTRAAPQVPMLWLHGGGYVAGSPRSALPPAAELARVARVRLLSVDYRLAPEHPFPAAAVDALTAYRAFATEVGAAPFAVGGESAGGGLALALLVAARDAGLPLPDAAVVFSPLVDLTMSGDSMATKASVDPILTRAALKASVRSYLGTAPPTRPGASPLFADLRGLPPLLVQVGSSEILLDDAVRFAARAAAADVAIELQVQPEMTHVYQARGPDVPSAAESLRLASNFLQRRLGTSA
ncbi:alpha/beta hydrolase fold domain-containing protein [Agromyces sp. ISL-38]|uniref:alpha/beta hydrolase fold domain-containing protein n=1 Tax=Agromyces sp. ISL-38 TaxID=2819107 RepID=UPI001BED3446|nr:alpha/beta hydrolase fold domain-containing protein [Agromyces sp. ISL-38]MBT2498853.1 alpha/beta hydrolase fold domain-containing protein [Agromyces sp. ISL-38]MBT2516462.1 alpha/beta hydrolase fold domain-containing protein [Streptomyces sp. ISL-90]